MHHTVTKRASWRTALALQRPLRLPAAHDALTARLIARAGFVAYQVGGFAVAGTMHAVPDVDLEHFGEKSASARNIIGASPLPVLIDGDDGYGDAKNVTRTVRDYERMGACALFLEDQRAPKRCGHMSGKEVVPPEVMVGKIRAAITARSDPDFFVLARTDALQPEGVQAAIDRAKRYLDAGADGVYVEGPRSVDELQTVGKALGDAPLATSILENGGVTPWVSPDDLGQMGYAMVLYPTTVLFRLTRAIERALADLESGFPLRKDEAVDMDAFEEIVEMPYWQEIEKTYEGR